MWSHAFYPGVSSYLIVIKRKCNTDKKHMWLIISRDKGQGPATSRCKPTPAAHYSQRPDTFLYIFMWITCALFPGVLPWWRTILYESYCMILVHPRYDNTHCQDGNASLLLTFSAIVLYFQFMFYVSLLLIWLYFSFFIFLISYSWHNWWYKNPNFF